MNFGRRLQSNQGSSMILVILIIILMSFLGIAIVAVTVNNFTMSGFYRDLNKAYYAAESGIGQIAKVLDKKVADIQETARISASNDIKSLLQIDPLQVRTTTGNEGSVNYTDSMSIYNTKYLNYFKTSLQSEFQNINDPYQNKDLLETTTFEGTFPSRDLGVDLGKVILELAEFNGVDYTVKVKVKGVFNDYPKELEVTFNLSPDPSPKTYGLSVKAGVQKKPDIPGILKKALVAEKNIVSAGGTVNITGDVISFGTVPVDASGEENQSAPWYEYGGIMAGLCSDVANNGLSGNSNKFGFDPAKTGTASNGTINITGNAATLSYIHSLFGTRANPSGITVTGDSYARSVRAEAPSNFSSIQLKNVYTTDNLQVDSFSAVADITGDYYGFVDAGYRIDGSNNNTLDKQLKDTYQFKRTSSVVVNGDSLINFHGKVFIGGSTFLRNYTDSMTHPYMTGISALKSSSRISSAFRKDDVSNPNPANPGSTLYWYTGGGNYTYPPPSFTTYTDKDGNPVDLITGRADDLSQTFTLPQRSMHFKGLWDALWNTDDIFSRYVDTGSIQILDNGITPGGKLKGFSKGAIAANGTIYTSNDFVDDTGVNPYDPNNFAVVEDQCTSRFYSAVGDFLRDPYDSSYPKLDFTTPSKHIQDYINTAKFKGINRILANDFYVSPLDPGAGFVYYGEGDTDIALVAGNWCIGGRTLPQMKGIVYVDGNIYVGNGFNGFDGMLIASGNIIFLGDANITYNAVDMDRLLNADVNIKGFFNLLTYDIPDEPVERQRLVLKNIRIDTWNEVPAN